jgi:hypothetical protein
VAANIGFSPQLSQQLQILQIFKINRWKYGSGNALNFDLLKKIELKFGAKIGF